MQFNTRLITSVATILVFGTTVSANSCSLGLLSGSDVLIGVDIWAENVVDSKSYTLQS